MLFLFGPEFKKQEKLKAFLLTLEEFIGKRKDVDELMRCNKILIKFLTDFRAIKEAHYQQIPLQRNYLGLFDQQQSLLPILKNVLELMTVKEKIISKEQLKKPYQLLALLKKIKIVFDNRSPQNDIMDIIASCKNDIKQLESLLTDKNGNIGSLSFDYQKYIQRINIDYKLRPVRLFSEIQDEASPVNKPFPLTAALKRKRSEESAVSLIPDKRKKEMLDVDLLEDFQQRLIDRLAIIDRLDSMDMMGSKKRSKERLKTRSTLNTVNKWLKRRELEQEQPYHAKITRSILTMKFDKMCFEKYLGGVRNPNPEGEDSDAMLEDSDAMLIDSLNSLHF